MTSAAETSRLEFTLPPELEAHEPPEARGPSRDAVRMLVADEEGRLVDGRFRDLPWFLEPGDLLVVNTSATVPAALDATGPDGAPLLVHLSSPSPRSPRSDLWLVEPREPRGGGHVRHGGGRPGDELALAGGGTLELVARYASRSRLWVARLGLPAGPEDYLARFGRPIRYRHVTGEWPLAAYQTVFALDPGSAEMPSAGRPFTPDVVTALVSRGVTVAPVVLHTGVSSLEHDEPPYPERYRVPEPTARLVESTRRSGGRVVAVGTTVVRALETVAAADGTVDAGEGWTDLVVTPARGVFAVDALLTGWHEPRASHLHMLEAIAGRELLARSYEAALDRGYLWHEFGDVELILRARPRPAHRDPLRRPADQPVERLSPSA